DPGLTTSFGFGLCCLTAVMGVLIVINRHRQSASATATLTQEFRTFQSSFVRVYLLALCAEWLQMGYLYMLLDFHGHGPTEIALVFFAGIISQLVATLLLEVSGGGGCVSNKARCIACLALQAVSCALLLHSAFGGLVCSRALGGVATALLQNAFEAWMVQQHASQGFPNDWLLQTFDLLSVGMSALATASGPLGETALSVGGAGGPFKLAIAVVAANALLVVFGWRRDGNKGCPACGDTGRLVGLAAAALRGNRRVALLAAQQGCFEAAMFVFAMAWTPLLAAPEDISRPTHHPPYALILAQFMVSLLIGSWAYKLLCQRDEDSSGWSPAGLCGFALFGSTVAFSALAVLRDRFGSICICLAFECCVGVYINAAGHMRATLMPPEVRGLVMGGAKAVVATAVFGAAAVPLAGQRTPLMCVCAALAAIALRCNAKLTALSEDGGGGE
ncbi:unnamed protein product, partial [Phaeothamnion confervicola]